MFHPSAFLAYDGTDVSKPFEDDAWELYHVARDFSEVHDVASLHPEKLEEMKQLWWREAAKYQVLPLNNQPGRFMDRRYRRSRHELHPGIGPTRGSSACGSTVAPGTGSTVLTLVTEGNTGDSWPSCR